jgi:hypothetical protein
MYLRFFASPSPMAAITSHFSFDTFHLAMAFEINLM